MFKSISGLRYHISRCKEVSSGYGGLYIDICYHPEQDTNMCTVQETAHHMAEISKSYDEDTQNWRRGEILLSSLTLLAYAIVGQLRL